MCWICSGLLLHDVIIALETGKDRSRHPGHPPSQASLAPSRAKLSCIKLLAGVGRRCLQEKISKVLPKAFQILDCGTMNFTQRTSSPMLSSVLPLTIDSPRPASIQPSWICVSHMPSQDESGLQAAPLSDNHFNQVPCGEAEVRVQTHARQALSAPVDDETTCLALSLLCRAAASHLTTHDIFTP